MSPDVETFFKAPKPAKRGLGRRRPAKVTDSSLWTMDLSVPIVVARSVGRCEHPDGCADRADVFHHRRGRGFAGCHAPKLILHLCEPHHLSTHAHPQASYRNGALLRRTARYELTVRSLAPEQYRACCPNCATWTPIVSDRRTAVQAATSCCAVPSAVPEEAL